MIYAVALCQHDGATRDECHAAVTMLEDAARTARRVFGGAHPTTEWIEDDLRKARAVLAARKTPSY